MDDLEFEDVSDYLHIVTRWQKSAFLHDWQRRGPEVAAKAKDLTGRTLSWCSVLVHISLISILCRENKNDPYDLYI